MERSFGVDFSSVQVHAESERAGGSVQALAEGNELHFAPGRYQPGTPEGEHLIAHELAHVVQQRGGADAVAGRHVDGTADGQREALEHEADAAAAAVMAGGRARIRLTAPMGMALRYEAYEHRQIARAGGGGRMVTIDNGQDEPFEIPYEEVVWLAGDFYGSVEGVKRAPKSELLRLLAITANQEGAANASGGRPAPGAQAAVDAEAQKATAWREHPAYDPKTHGPTGRQRGEVEGAEQRSFQTLATKNNDHFSTENMRAWETSHREAVAVAKKAHSDPTHRSRLLNDALLHDAFGAHFLTDAFASGHLLSGKLGRQLGTAFFAAQGAQVREAVVAAALADPTVLANRLDLQSRMSGKPAALREMIARSYSVALAAADMMEKIDDLLLKTVHDQLNQEGIAVRNRRGDAWTTSGDLALHKSPRTMALASEAVQLSRTEVEETAATGRVPADPAPPYLVPDQVQVCGTWLPIAEFSSRAELFLGYLRTLTLDHTPGNRLYRMLKDNMATTLSQFTSDYLERAATAIGEGQLAQAEQQRRTSEATAHAVAGGARFVAGAVRAAGGALVGEHAQPDDTKLRDTGTSGAGRTDGGAL